MVTLSSVGYGFCGACRQQAAVGQMLVEGFRHPFFLCATCLRTMDNRIEREAAAIAERNAKRTGGS